MKSSKGTIKTIKFSITNWELSAKEQRKLKDSKVGLPLEKIKKTKQNLASITSYKTKDVNLLIILVIWRAKNWDKEEAKERSRYNNQVSQK